MGMDETWKKRLRDQIDISDHDMKSLSQKSGFGDTLVFDILKRTGSPTINKLVAITDILGISLNWLLYGDDELRDTPIVGYAGGGGDVVNFDDVGEAEGLGMVKTPIDKGKLQAVIVRGDSMKPRYLDGSIVAFGSHAPTIDSIEGKECIVRTVEGQAFLKRVHKGTKKGFVVLDSYNADAMVDVKIEWAAPILWREMV